MPTGEKTVLQLDLDAVLRQKLGRRARCVPRFVVRALERAICIDRLNVLLQHNGERVGAEFARGVIDDLDVHFALRHEELLPAREHRRVMIVSNHPLGGLDGLALIAIFERYFGGQVYFIVNDMLMAVEPLRSVFVPVNTVGSQNRGAVRGVDEVFASDNPVMIFPAGLVSRLGDDGSICDLEWKKMFVNKAIEYQRDIIPLFVGGENSKFFYKFARLRKRLGIKFNIEMVRLPRELFSQEHKTIDIECGQMIPWQTLKGGLDARATAQKIKNLVYDLKNKQ